MHPLEVKTLATVKEGRDFHARKLADDLGWKLGQANQAISWLAGKECLAEVRRDQLTSFELTELGQEWAGAGSPAQRILDALAKQGPLSLPEIAAATGIEARDVGSAYGQLAKLGAVSMNDEKKAFLVDAAKAGEVAQLRKLLELGQQGPIDPAELDSEDAALLENSAKKRGAASAPFRFIERELVWYRVTDLGIKMAAALSEAGVSGDELSVLTSDMLKTGSWKKSTFRPYSVDLKPARIPLGRRNPYCEYLDWVKDKLVALGFEEFDGPLVESEFWNSDALFMPQFHSARDIHDVYYLDNPRYAKEIEQPFLDRVAAAHANGGDTGSRGWEYTFDRDFTRRLILRSQGTVMSAKSLHSANVPGKYFGVLRCFRYDQVDATHLSDFYQTEGIVLGEDVNLRNLLGLLKMFAEEVAGATEVKYVPGYFPFTEPSVEVHIKHPVLGWFELGGAGIFRPEVTAPMGVNVPVLAWGLGIDRMALMHLGLNDLRELFSNNIENVRLRRKSGA